MSRLMKQIVMMKLMSIIWMIMLMFYSFTVKFLEHIRYGDYDDDNGDDDLGMLMRRRWRK